MTIWLDSGAFSAWNVGREIDLEHYIAYIKANIEHIDYYVNLDVIPGSFGVVPSPAEVEASAEAGWANMLRMEAEGLKPIPVFHMGEQFKWLRRMVEHGCPYIGISPANDRTTDKKRLWLDRVFSEITDKAGLPVVKTHAFGVTAIELLIRYPWYSADSTTWIMAAARGKIVMPRRKANGNWDFSKSWICRISEYREKDRDNPAFDQKLPELWWRSSPKMFAIVEQWLAQAGSSLTRAETDYKERARLCCYFFQEFERNFKPVPFKRSRAHLFEDD